jgi:hypothetical protein
LYRIDCTYLVFKLMLELELFFCVNDARLSIVEFVGSIADAFN